MIYQPEYMKALLKKHMELRASPSEIEMLMLGLDLYDEEEIARMLDQTNPDINFEEHQSRQWETPSFRTLQRRINKKRSRKAGSVVKIDFTRAAVFIGIFLLTCLTAWFFRSPSKLLIACGGLSGDSEIPTGVYSCSLMLNNGCSIFIDSTYKGPVTKEGNTEIMRLTSGELFYKRADLNSLSDTTQQMVNTITTSAGDQYQVILPDGSRVRLNAASSIRFPVEFSAAGRVVTLEGEAFFDIKSNKTAPFYIYAGNAEIRALGTSFNVNAYSENTITTLLSGSLEVKNNEDSVRLKPGQEAIAGFAPATKGNPRITVHTADTTKTISWKKVLRIYEKVPLKAFLSDIARWYNLEIQHTECIPDGVISATLCYETPLSKILALLRANGLRFIREGRKIVFCPARK
ncbi:MAG: FecR domain-containing protein [Bacteroidota bacterium]|nr:FecR domain-containing protein [Bacteroidota bacterium]MDP4213069.1 FecR domain-containing protein [Bacteroidota bacterium]MDP4252126.1 FecR domain-containing protein [Bacteroidota bacterium]